DTPIAIRLVLHVHHARCAARLLRLRSRHFCGHAQRSLQRDAHLQGRGRGKKEATARNIYCFRKMLTQVRTYIQSAKTQRRADVVATNLASFGAHRLSVLPRLVGLRGLSSSEGALSVTEQPGASSHKKRV